MYRHSLHRIRRFAQMMPVDPRASMEGEDVLPNDARDRIRSALRDSMKEPVGSVKQ